MSDVQTTDNPEQQRYEARVDGELAGFAEYQLDGDRVVFTHTEVDDAFEGQGVGSALARVRAGRRPRPGPSAWCRGARSSGAGSTSTRSTPTSSRPDARPTLPRPELCTELCTGDPSPVHLTGAECTPPPQICPSALGVPPLVLSLVGAGHSVARELGHKSSSRQWRGSGNERWHVPRTVRSIRQQRLGDAPAGAHAPPLPDRTGHRERPPALRAPEATQATATTAAARRAWRSAPPAGRCPTCPSRGPSPSTATPG